MGHFDLLTEISELEEIKLDSFIPQVSHILAPCPSGSS